MFWTHTLGAVPMKKTLIVTTALLTLLSAAACTTVGKYPVGKAPVVTKG